MISLVNEASAAGASQTKACNIVGISPRTLQRYRQNGDTKPDGRKEAARNRVPANKLSNEEREEILSVVNSAQFAHQPPSQIVPALADQGVYLASEATFYRILREEKQLAHRGRAKAPSHSKPKEIMATAPNQLWSWDITYLSTTVRGIFFYLYLFLDIYSRKIVGWEVFAEESADHAASTFRKAYLRQSIAGKPLILHSDNGSPMKGSTMLGSLQKLGVAPSFSRPAVSNDNPYSESLFNTLKYHPGLPDNPFDSLENARLWVSKFVYWYNNEHRHSALKFVTPDQRHQGEDREILKKRISVYESAKAKRPERWSKKCRNWDMVKMVFLNPNKSSKSKAESVDKAVSPS